jgi:hypothetical protein
VLGCELCVSVGCCVIGTDAWGAITDALWDIGAAMGLIGLVGFVGFEIDFTQVFEDVTHEPHTGCPYGLGQVLLMVCTTLPV